MAADVRPEDIGVTARTIDFLDEVAAVLQAAGIAVRALDSTDGIGPRRPDVVLASMHRPRVSGEDSIERERIFQQERCLLYVAATSARDALRVSWHGEPSSFVQPLLAVAGRAVRWC